jgi:Transposase IS66 family
MLLQVPIPQGSLSKMHKLFCESLQAPYEKLWELIQEPGIRCVDETSYRLNGVNYWIWVANSTEDCVLMLAPSRSSREVNTLLGEDQEFRSFLQIWRHERSTFERSCPTLSDLKPSIFVEKIHGFL